MWCGMYVNSFWMFVMYIQVNLVFVDFDVCFSVMQFCQYGVESIWLCVMVDNFVVRNCCCYQESIGFDMIWQNVIDIVV